MPKVLLLEDLDSDVQEIKSALEQIGTFELERFRAASQAIEYLSQALSTGKGLPTLIVCDLNLPASSGFEVLRFYHATPQLQEVPLVVWSVMDGETEKKLTTWMGAKKLISKNTGPTTLRKAIASVLKSASSPQTA